jgi:hypothetical protein
MPSIRFSLSISADEIQKYYRGAACNIVTTSYDGRNVQFPANLALPYVTHSGIQGAFCLKYHNNGKAIALTKE